MIGHRKFENAEMVRHCLPISSREALIRLMESHSSEQNDPDSKLLKSAEQAVDSLPEDLVSDLRSLNLEVGSPHALLLEDFPVDSVSITASGLCTKHGCKVEISILSVLLAAEIQPLQYLQESDRGRLVKEITPNPVRPEVVSSGGYLPLGMHTDNPFLGPSFWPEFLVLCCVENRPRVPTRLASLSSVVLELERLDTDVLSLLFEDRYSHRAPNSFAFRGSIFSRNTPILANRSGRPEIAVGLYGGISSSSDPNCQDALRALSSAAESVAFEVILEPGQILIWDNQTMLHSRGRIPKGSLRYLQRLYGRRDLRDLHAATSEVNSVFDCAPLFRGS